MTILFSADLHGNEMILTSFVERLRRPAYDCGVIAGDLLEDHLTFHEIDRLLQEADLADSTPTEERLSRALLLKERELKGILFRVGKPVFVVRGNHDRTPWFSERNVNNIHSKRVYFKGYNLIGYEHTEFSRTEEDQQKDFARLRHFIDDSTVLITHMPAYGILDLTALDSTGERIGSKGLLELMSGTRALFHLHGHVHASAGIHSRTINGACASSWFYAVDLKTNWVTQIPIFAGQETATEQRRRVR